MNELFEVFESSRKGRGLKALNLLAPGKVIVKEDACVAVVSQQNRRKLCDACFKAKDTLLKCSKCKFVFYCGKSCQRKAWPVHKIECECLLRAQPRKPTDLCLFTSRILLKFFLKTRTRNELNDNSFISNLISNREHIEDTREDMIVANAYVAKTFLGPVLKDLEIQAKDIIDILCKITCNSFTIIDDELQALGVGLFRTASFINHSCTPNALALFSGSEIVIRATKNIQPGEEITISYIEILQTTKERHNELQERYFFQCQCERCCNEETFGVDGLMDSYKCQNLDCDVPFVFDMSKGCNTDLTTCSSCGRSMPVNEVKRKADPLVRRLKNNIEQYNKSKLESDLEKLKKTFEEASNLLHTFNISIVRGLDCLMDAYLDTQQWENVLECGKKLIEPHKKYYPGNHPSRGLLFYKIGKLQLYLEHLLEGIESLQNACQILSVTHGDDYKLVDDLKDTLAKATKELLMKQVNDHLRELNSS